MRGMHTTRFSRDRETDENSRDEATKGESKPERERRPFSYYYDDGTGYELFDPSKEDDEDEASVDEDDETRLEDEGSAASRSNTFDDAPAH